jgi:hypothetical protein
VTKAKKDAAGRNRAAIFNECPERPSKQTRFRQSKAGSRLSSRTKNRDRIRMSGMTLKASCFRNRGAMTGRIKKSSAHSNARTLLHLINPVFEEAILIVIVSVFIQSGK